MSTFSTILALLVAYKAVLLPLLAGVVGYLFPSPFQKAAKAQADTKAAEDQATASKGNVKGLDELP